MHQNEIGQSYMADHFLERSCTILHSSRNARCDELMKARFGSRTSVRLTSTQSCELNQQPVRREMRNNLQQFEVQRMYV
uniref:Uncharacterized protein n=1 Tax=Romanomermis culicivorax TaxID=13658 RepID=A0A915ID44_ROMCU